MGQEALEDIVYRAQLELFSQPLLVRPAACCVYEGKTHAVCISIAIVCKTNKLKSVLIKIFLQIGTNKLQI